MSVIDIFEREKFNDEYAKLLSAARAQFEEHYLDAFRGYAAIAGHELADLEQDYYGFTEEPESADGREPATRFLISAGREISEPVFRFGTHLDLRREDGTWNFGVVRRHITAEVRPLMGDLIISAFIFEDRGGLGDPDRHGMWFPTIPLPLNRDWNVAHFLADMWRRVAPIRSKDLIPQSVGWWNDPTRVVPAELVAEELS